VPRFFFHLRSPSGELARDDVGVELPDLDSAVREAEFTACTFTRDAKLGGFDHTGWHFEIRSDAGSLNVPAFVTETETA
jgi:hypothetical protein